MATNVYTMLSHNCKMLQAQIAMIRKNVVDLGRIFVVQGPYGRSPTLDGGKKKILPATAEQLGVEILEVGADVGGMILTYRVPKIVSNMITHSLGQPERYAFILHGDCVPLMSTDARAVLDQHDIASRGEAMAGGVRIWPTWFALDSESPNAQNIVLHGLWLHGDCTAKLYGAEQATEDNERIPEELRKLTLLDDHVYEWCPPVWLHLNRLLAISNEEVDHKLAGLMSLIDEALPVGDPCIELTGELPLYKPRMAGPMRMVPVTTASPGHNNVDQFKLAVQEWEQAGKPMRSPDEIDFIYHECCRRCRYFKKNACTACSSRIRGDEPGLLNRMDGHSELPIINKICVATEHCPMWQW